MKKIILSFLLIAQAGLLLAQKNNNKEPYLVKNFKSESIRNIEAKTSGGSISIEASEGVEARVEVYIRGNNWNDNISRDEIEKRLAEKYNLDVSVNGNKLTVVAKTKAKISNWKKTLSISFKIFVPKNISTDLSTSGGSITLVGVSGNQDFRTSGGSLHVENVSGTINGRTSGGSIYVKDSKDDIRLATSGGSITAKDCTGKIQLSTSGGSLDLNGLSGNIKATTSGGSVKGGSITGEFITHTSGGSIRLDDLACSLDASTSGGNIDVAINRLGDYVKLRNSGGNIEISLPKGKGMDLDLAGNKIRTSELNNFDGTTDDDELVGTINGGGVPVRARTSSGRISISFK